MEHKKNIRGKIGALLVGAVALAGCYLPRRDEPCHDLHEPKSQIEQKIINTPVRIIYNTPVRIEYNNAGRDVNVVKITEEREPKREMIGDSAGKVIFENKLNGYDVVYKEGVFDKESGKRANVLEFWLGDNKYTFYDFIDAHSIDEEPLKDAVLERIVVSGKLNRRFNYAEGGEAVLNAFTESNKCYNDARRDIRSRMGGAIKIEDDKDFERALKSFDELRDDKKGLDYF